jgi:transposase
MSGFKDENHFASWLGLTPSKDISAGKTVRRGKKKVNNRVAVALRTASTTLLESDSYLGARYRHLRRQLPTFASAVKAMATACSPKAKPGWIGARRNSSEGVRNGNWQV